MKEFNEKEIDILMRQNRMVRLMLAKIPTWVDEHKQEGIEYSSGKFVTFWIKGGDRLYDQPAGDHISNLMKTLLVFLNETESVNSGTVAGHEEKGIALMPDMLTEALLKKYEKLSFFEKLTMFQNTDKRFVKTKKGPGNQVFSFVEGHYMCQVLNLITGYKWDVQLTEMKETENEVICIGKILLNCHDTELYYQIEKAAIGQADKKFSKETKELIMIGDTYKAAEMDMIKKAASYLGIAADVYRGEV